MGFWTFADKHWIVTLLLAVIGYNSLRLVCETVASLRKPKQVAALLRGVEARGKVAA